MVRKTFLPFVVVILFVRGLLAQAPDHLQSHAYRPTYDGPPLSLKAAIDEALQNNPALKVLRQQYETARLRPSQERFLMPPTLEAQIWQWPITTVNPLNTNMYMFTIQQEVPGPGKRDLRAAVGQADAALALNDIAVRGRDVVNQVMRAYSDLMIARRSTEIHLTSVELLRQFAEVSTTQYATGRRPQQDALKAVAELSKVHEDLVMHEQDTALAAARLNVLLDRNPDAPIGALDEPRDTVTLPPSTELQRLAVEHQPDLQAAQLAVERAKASQAATNREDRPDFVVGGGYMLMPREAGAWTATVGVTWPNAPWARGRVDARKAEANADIEMAVARVHATERAIQLAVHEAYVRATAAIQRASLLRTTVMPQSEQTMESARIAYQTDRLDFLSLVDTQRGLLDAQLNYFRALSDREVALADLARAVGVENLPPAAPSLPEVTSR
jgi:outer membrane protein TolC